MEEIHDLARLRELQALPLYRKIGFTAARIEEFVKRMNGKAYISFSGGMDSGVLFRIARGLFPNLPAVFIDTGLEYPEIKVHVARHENITTIRPKMNFIEVINKVGYPVVSKEVAHTLYHARRGAEYMLKKLRGESRRADGKLSMFNCPKWAFLLDVDFEISDHCCDEMKKKPAKKYEKATGNRAIIGTLAEDSLLRRQKWVKHGCNSFEIGKEFCSPLSFWTRQDILRYALEMKVPVCPVYGDIVEDGMGGLKTTGVKNTGCIFCMFGAHHKDDNRFSELARTHPQLYDYCMRGGRYVDGIWKPHNGLGLQHVLDVVMKKENATRASRTSSPKLTSP